MGVDENGSSTKCTPTRLKNCLKTFFVHLFSHVGLCVLVVGYVAIGGLIFQKIEFQDPKVEKFKLETELNRTRKQHVSNLWNITDRLNVLYESNWTREVEIELEKFEDFVKKSKVNETKLEMDWSLPSALLYSVSIVTTIGYGNTFPQTMPGKMFTMLYAVIGVPIMLLWVSNIGNVMAHAFEFAYFHAPFCGSLSSSKNSSNRKTVQSQRSKKIQKPKSKFEKSHIPLSDGVSTKVEFSLRNEKYETVVLENSQTSSPSLRSPSTPAMMNKYKTNGRKNNKSNKKLFKNLDPTARQILLECAEYNLSQVDSMDERSRQLVEQFTINEDLDEGDDVDGSRRSSDVESVIEVMSSGHQGRFIDGPMVPHPTFDYDIEKMDTSYSHIPPNGTGKKNGNRNVSIIDSLQNPHGTPSRIPLLADRDVIDTEIERPETERVLVRESSYMTVDRVPVSLVLFIVVLYIVLGASVFTIQDQEDWNFWDSAYFCFITLSTIGLVHFVPCWNKLDESSELSGTKRNFALCRSLVPDTASSRYLSPRDMTPGKSLEHSGSNGSTVQLIFCCFYLVIGLAIIAMSFNLVQEQVTIKVTGFARRVGIIEKEFL